MMNATDQFAEGTTVDRRYVLKRAVADDGAARVYVAEHIHTKREVIVKRPRDRGAHSFERMRREIEALAKVRGPGVSEILDAGEADGEPYLVLELLTGRSLAGLLAARGRLSVPESVKIGVEVATALARCHARGVVHRDLKPGNLFVTHGDAPQLCLLDFGIAKLDDDAPRLKITREDGILGTPEYMAPEALLDAGNADARSDIYGLGVTLYECLTGTVPFDGRYAEVLMKVSTTSARPLEELLPDAPSELARVIDRSLNRAPADRWASAREMADALRASVSDALDGVDLLGRRPPPPAISTLVRGVPTRVDAPRPKAAHDAASRRRFPRAQYSSLSRIALPEGALVDGRIEEVSEGGTQFVGDQAIESGKTVSIRFALPGSGRIATARATARWNRTVRGTNATGFEFVDLSEEARAEIRKYVSFMCPAPGSVVE